MMQHKRNSVILNLKRNSLIKNKLMREKDNQKDLKNQEEN